VVQLAGGHAAVPVSRTSAPQLLSRLGMSAVVAPTALREVPVQGRKARVN
jgi:hypothetical protein